MEYRGYTIEENCYGFGFDYYQNGEAIHTAKSIENAKRDIDDTYFEDQQYKVGDAIFLWLSEALEHIKKFGGVLECKFEFDTI